MKADYEIRQETEKDYPQVFKLVEEAFRDMEESDHREQFLVERLRHSPAFVPELSLVADGDGGVVGCGLAQAFESSLPPIFGIQMPYAIYGIAASLVCLLVASAVTKKSK